MSGLGHRRGHNIKHHHNALIVKGINPLNCLLGIVITVTSITLLITVLYFNSNSNDNNQVSSYSSSLSLSYNNNNDNNKPITVAYAISLIKCGDKQSTPDGLVDAAIVLRHSVHLTSVRNPASGSNYDYKMYAIVHKDAERCSSLLEDAGFTVLVKDPPISKSEIQDDNLRKNIHRALCCGHDEFVKLYAYTLPEPIVVHVDIDFIFYKPMDTLFDAMMYDANTPRGKAARLQIPVERPYKTIDDWPKRIDCFMTRDWPQVMPGRKAGYQAGFLVIRPSHEVFNTILDVIRTTPYVDGFGRDNGWGGKGYGGFIGAMAMQGLLAYVYDAVLPNNWVELNQCRYNHMGMDVLYRSMPSFRNNHPKVGKCRNDLDYCEDCMFTNLTDIYSVHYTMCRKPWQCVGEGSRQDKFGKESIPEDQADYNHCMKLITIWHNVRTDLENKMLDLTGDETIENGRSGTYKTDIFQGHCNANGNKGYVSLSGKNETFRRMLELYN